MYSLECHCFYFGKKFRQWNAGISKFMFISSSFLSVFFIALFVFWTGLRASQLHGTVRAPGVSLQRLNLLSLNLGHLLLLLLQMLLWVLALGLLQGTKDFFPQLLCHASEHRGGNIQKSTLKQRTLQHLPRLFMYTGHCKATCY